MNTLSLLFQRHRARRQFPASRRWRARHRFAVGFFALVAGVGLVVGPALQSVASGERSAQWVGVPNNYRGANLVQTEDGARHAVCATDRQSDDTSRGGTFTYPSSQVIGPGQAYVTNPATFHIGGGVEGPVEVASGQVASQIAFLLDVGYAPARLPGGPSVARDDVTATLYTLAPRGVFARSTPGDPATSGAVLDAIAPFVGPYTLPDPEVSVAADGTGTVRVAAPRSAAGRAMTGVALSVRLEGAHADTGGDTVMLAAQEQPHEIPIEAAGDEVAVSVTATGLPASTYEVWESPDLQDRLVTGQPTTLSAEARAVRLAPPPPTPPVEETPPPPATVPPPPPPVEETPPPPATVPPPPTPPVRETPPPPATVPPPPTPPVRETPPPAPPKLAQTGVSSVQMGGGGLVLVGMGLVIAAARTSRRP